ncbi:MAG TPA: OmpH family outer membrane protein [Flavobacteriaceae bacterium]|nr:OmpH family outer membrane protein [Flavobacteriaceae bacterium]
MKKSIFLLMGIFLLVSCNQEKTAYVNNKKLIQEYKGMEDTEAEFTKKTESITKSLDSVALKFQQEVQAYQAASQSMSSSERQKKEEELMAKQQQLRQRQQMIGQAMNQQSTKAIDSIITVVKDFVAEYGKEHGYTYIFGSTEAANIMYAKEGKDVTEEILKELNAAYEK